MLPDDDENLTMDGAHQIGDIVTMTFLQKNKKDCVNGRGAARARPVSDEPGPAGMSERERESFMMNRADGTGPGSGPDRPVYGVRSK